LTPGVNPATIAAGTPTGVSFTGIPTTAATPGLTSTATSSIAAGTDALTGQLTALSSTTPATIAAGTPTGDSPIWKHNSCRSVQHGQQEIQELQHS
jgi:hypothetical protein